MDFNDNKEEAAFRAEAAAWLKANAPSEEELAGMDELAAAKMWQKRKYDAGWACIRWDKEFGGRGANAIQQVIWNQEEAKYKVPAGFFVIGQGMAAPTLMTWGKPEHHERYLPKLASGEEIWCQLFSEPAGGSDLAALRTKAERDGDDWIINGQKIWTSGAHYSDYGILVVRTDPNVPKHKGLSYFFLDMKSPGVEIKPIKQLTGGANFNEVYFTDVRIPDSQRLGEVGQGWQVALTTLMNERAAIGGGGAGVNVEMAYRIANEVMIDDKPAIADSAVRAKLANWYVQESGLRFTGYRPMTAMSRGEIFGPENPTLFWGAPNPGRASFVGPRGNPERRFPLGEKNFVQRRGPVQPTFWGPPGGAPNCGPTIPAENHFGSEYWECPPKTRQMERPFPQGVQQAKPW
ncbi:MAG: acyl-CoA dehydrogenase [Pseudomonadota bacterium]|nr:MAG: acyl-CoA dehydrogenase [Pseudomonadota bacterium]